MCPNHRISRSLNLLICKVGMLVLPSQSLVKEKQVSTSAALSRCHRFDETCGVRGVFCTAAREVAGQWLPRWNPTLFLLARAGSFPHPHRWHKGCSDPAFHHPGSLLKIALFGASGWLSRVSVRLSISAQVMISLSHGFEPHIRLCAGSMEPAWDSLPPSLSAPPLLVLPLSLPKNKFKKVKNAKSEKKRRLMLQS